jgi:hypothetical protein
MGTNTIAVLVTVAFERAGIVMAVASLVLLMRFA